MTNILHKVCKRCNTSKLTSEFYTQRSNKDGLNKKCKDCYNSDCILNRTPEQLEKRRLKRRQYKSKTPRALEDRYKYRARWHVRDKIKNKLPGYDYHHWSYLPEDWLDVIPLKRSIHSKVHSFLTYIDSEKKYATKDGVILQNKKAHIDYITFRLNAIGIYFIAM